jgi:hypothetical protein
MNAPIPGEDGDLATMAAPGHERHDVRQRDIVNHAILVQESANTVSALEYLKSHDIDACVIERVLLEPHRRRRLGQH